MTQISILLCAVYYHGNGWCLFCFSCKRCIPTEFWFSANIRELSFHIIIQKNFHLQAQKKSISCIWSFPAIFLLKKKMPQKLIPETSLCLIYELNQECLWLQSWDELAQGLMFFSYIKLFISILTKRYLCRIMCLETFVSQKRSKEHEQKRKRDKASYQRAGI